MIDPFMQFGIVKAFYEAGLARLLIENEANIAMLQILAQQAEAQRQREILDLERMWRLNR